eukprot:gene41609-51543_t
MANDDTPFQAEANANAAIESLPSSLESRRHQMFPMLTDAEIKRMERFGTVRHFRNGERLFEAGRSTFGMLVILRGRVAISRYDGLGNTSLIIEHGAGQFCAEVGQLSDRPSLVNGDAVGEVEVLVIPSESLRALVVAEAELNDVEGVVAIPGAVAFLNDVPSDQWALVTSAPRELALRRLQAAGQVGGEGAAVKVLLHALD